MFKFISIAVLVILVGGSWLKFYQSGDEAKKLSETIEELVAMGDPEEKVPALKVEMNSREGERTFTGILLCFLSAGLVGIVFVIWLLPILAHKLTHAVYDSGEQVEADPFHDARVLMAQGDWDGAISSFKLAAQQDPLNRMPWVEIAKIQRVNLEAPQAAIETLRQAIEGQEWQENDAAFLMFRLAEIYDEDLQERVSATAIMEQVVEQFPESRHSANARAKLLAWGLS